MISPGGSSFLSRKRIQDAIRVVQRENAELRNQLEDFGEEQAEWERLCKDRVRLLAMVEEEDEA